MSVQLTRDQARAWNYVQQGKNIFLTGRAGTGKSFTLRYIVKQLDPERTFVTATTGCAAVNIGGTTYHKFFGVGLGRGTAEQLLRTMTEQGRKNLIACHTLVIDEISMMTGEMFDKLETIAREVRGYRFPKFAQLPFGGIQIVVSGDFFQCPPVGQGVQCFEAATWRSIEVQFELQEVIRQREPLGVGFVNALRDSDVDRWGRVKLAKEWIELMDYLRRPLRPRRDGLLPTRLYCTNRDVDRENRDELARIPGELEVYTARDVGTEAWINEMLTSCPAADELRLKTGAQVMLIKNLTATLINGSRGVVTRFQHDVETGEKLPLVKFKNGEEAIIKRETWRYEDSQGRELASRTQIALKLAWAGTCHKFQGQTLDYVEVYINDAFEFGLAYVALTRFTSLAGLRIARYDPMKIRNNPKVVGFNRAMRLRPENQVAD